MVVRSPEMMEKRSRRNFLRQSSMAGLAPLVSSVDVLPTGEGQLFHQVYFWLKEPGNQAHRSELIKGLNTLRKITQIKQLHIGIPASTEKREVVDNSWDVSELMVFADTTAQKVYQDHPLHKAFVEQYGHLWEKVVVYDSWVAG